MVAPALIICGRVILAHVQPRTRAPQTFGRQATAKKARRGRCEGTPGAGHGRRNSGRGAGRMGATRSGGRPADVYRRCMRPWFVSWARSGWATGGGAEKARGRFNVMHGCVALGAGGERAAVGRRCGRRETSNAAAWWVQWNGAGWTEGAVNYFGLPWSLSRAAFPL